MKGGFNLAKLCANKWLRLAFLVLVIYFGYNYLFTRREGLEAHAYGGAKKDEEEEGMENKEKKEDSVDDLNKEISEIENAEEKESFRNLTAWA